MLYLTLVISHAREVGISGMHFENEQKVEELVLFHISQPVQSPKTILPIHHHRLQ
jgi:hypothetical protein